MSSRFQIQPDGTRCRIVNINGDVYKLTVEDSIWNNSKVSSHTGYWIRRKREGKNVRFKYGSVEVVESIPDEPTYECKECDKIYHTRDSLYKHIRRDHSEITNGETELSNVRTEGTVTNNITNNNINNINNTINITMRPFGEENPNWLTAEFLHEILQNLNGSIPRMIQEKHFNDNFPENQNIQISDVRHLHKRLRVYEKSGWRIRNREKVLRGAMTKAYSLLYDAINNDVDDDDETDEAKLHRKEIRRLHNSRRAQRTIERALRLFDDYQPYTESTAEEVNDEFDTMLLDCRERNRGIDDGSRPATRIDADE